MLSVEGEGEGQRFVCLRLREITCTSCLLRFRGIACLLSVGVKGNSVYVVF